MSAGIKERILQYVMLTAGVLMLLSVVLPHHHHRDGMPCYLSLTEEMATHGDQSSDAHDCACNGHNLAYFQLQYISLAGAGGDLHLMPLLVLFDYLYPPEPVSIRLLANCEGSGYIESLYDTWIVGAVGLRAPPMS